MVAQSATQLQVVQISPCRTKLHLAAGLERRATMHLRPLDFLDDLDSSLVLLIEGLMMDFLGTIDRTGPRGLLLPS